MSETIRKLRGDELIPYRDMVIYDLMDMTSTEQAYLIYPDNSADTAFFQQVAGQLCDHRLQPGRIRAIGDQRFGRDIPEVGCTTRLTRSEADTLDAYFVASEMPIRVDRDKLDQSTEAWVYVLAPGSHSLVGEVTAILTWENCD